MAFRLPNILPNALNFFGRTISPFSQAGGDFFSNSGLKGKIHNMMDKQINGMLDIQADTIKGSLEAAAFSAKMNTKQLKHSAAQTAGKNAAQAGMNGAKDMANMQVV